MELAQQEKREYSVTAPEEWEKQNIGTISYILPFPFFGNRDLLPTTLPIYQWDGFYNQRDIILLSTPKIEPEGWGVAIGKATAKFASKSWRVTSKTKLRARRLQDMLKNAGAGVGVFGWSQFAAVTFRSYSLVGKVFIEIERDRMDRIVNIHYLNPLRCQMRNDSEYPVAYLRNDGSEVIMHRKNVAVITDTLDPTLGEFGIVTSAAERAYTAIVRMNSANWYTIEKVRGERPLSMSFVQGLNPANINDAIETARQDQERKGEKSFMGAVVIPVMSDIPLTVVEIPLASLPDKFDINAERTRSDLIYANALGLDPQDINPALLASGSIGTGTQALVLAEAAKGNTMAVFAKMMTRFLSDLDDECEFEFEETDYSDEMKRAEIQQKRAETAKIYVDAGLLDTNQALNMLVDEGDIPEAFLTVDETDAETLTDTENAEATLDKGGETTQKNRRPFSRIRHKQTTAEQAANLPAKLELQRQLERIIRRQFDTYPVNATLHDIGKENLETVTRAELEQAVAKRIQPLEPTDGEMEKILAALLLLAMFGIKQSGISLTPLELAQAQAQAEAYIAQRLAVLLNGETIETDAPPAPDIRNPNLPPSSHTQDGEPIAGLNAGGVTIIALMLLAAINQLKAEGKPITYTAVQAAYKKAVTERAKTRAEIIADTEASRGASVGELAALGALLIAVGLWSRRKPKTKTWLLTTSKDPRVAHLAQVGVTVPFDATFPDGSYWSNELPNCKCGIRVGYK
jgi:hypothetical protein